MRSEEGLAVDQVWYDDHHTREQWVTLTRRDEETGVWFGIGETGDEYPLDPGDLHTTERPRTFADEERTADVGDHDLYS